MKVRHILLLLLALCLIAVPAFAQVDLYDNGPTDGTTDAWTINFGFEMSNSFVLSNAASVNGVTFAAWLFPGDVLESLEVSITSGEFGGTVYFDGLVNTPEPGTGLLFATGIDVCNETASFLPVAMNAGTYWLNLQNAIVNTGDPVYWDENGGPSGASNNSVGTMPSESFTILGASTTTSTTGTTPEPGTLMMVGSGALGLLGFLRRKSSR